MKILTVLGARPQFVKASPLCAALRAAGHQEVLVHTGQHYDDRMSKIFFDELPLPRPDVNLGIGGGGHGEQTGRMLVALEPVVRAERPDKVLVYGDTNSTLAGALVASKLRVPLAHVEAGLRSYDRAMPEEINRVLTDHCADTLFCPTATAVKNLEREGITRGVWLVGDTMLDCVRLFAPTSEQAAAALAQAGVTRKGYVLATVHRQSNTDDPLTLRALLGAFSKLGLPVVFPLHPRTRKRMAEHGIRGEDSTRMGAIRFIEPVGYRSMLALEDNARVVITDSGGVQKEAFFLGVPCVTVRSETEWVETLADGWNVVTGTDEAGIRAAVSERLTWQKSLPPPSFGDGRSAVLIARLLGDERAIQP